MDKAETYRYLDSRGIAYEVTEHPAVYSMAQLDQVALPYPADDAKNLFVRDDKKRAYYLITVRGDKRVDLKAFRRRHGTRPLTFASAEDLAALLKLTPGSVTPLGLLNDTEHRVTWFLDRDFTGRIGVHPNDNTATVWMQAADLADLIRDHGNPVHPADIE